MTDLRTDAPVVGRRSGYAAQWPTVTRLLVAEGLRTLLITTAAMLAIGVVGSLVARWRGWQLMTTSDLDAVSFEVVADSDGVTIVASLLFVPGGVGVAALVMAFVLAARTRVFVAAGATRASVAVGNLVTAFVMTAYVLVVTGIVLAVVAGGVGRAAELLGAEGAGDLAVLAVRGLGAVLLALVGAITITTVFLRWPWWVGALVLPALAILLPWLVGWALPGLADAVGQAVGRPGFDLATAVVTAAVYWVIVRRVPVP